MEDQTEKPIILLIEDDPILSKMYTEKFTLEGFTVLTAFDGESGLQKAMNETYNLLVLDIMMPKLSGTELLTKLRSTSRGKDLPVIVITNLSDKTEQQKLEALHVYSFFTKAEITPGILTETVKKALNLSS
jgi:DNA-binding response OmpR family regulator